MLFRSVVVNYAGLVGKITAVYSDRSVVLLATDSEYAIEAKVSAAAEDPKESPTGPTTPSGIPVGELFTTTSAPTTTALGGSNNNGGSPVATVITTTTTTTIASETSPGTTVKPVVVVPRDTGAFEGRGSGRLPAMRFVTERSIEVGAVISTAGGSKSLAPPDIIIGEVINVIRRAGSAGPLLEVRLAANLAQLNFVQVVLYRPPSEVPSP